MKKETALYRHFNAAGVLLYVGVAFDQLRRLKQHEYSAQWHREIDHIRIQWFDSRDDALAAERAAVEQEKPLFNTRLQERDQKGCWAIFHPYSRSLDGNYFRLQTIRETLKGWQELFPAERFVIVEVPKDRPVWPGRVLRSIRTDWCEFPGADNWLTPNR